MNKSYLSPKEVAQSWIDIGKGKVGYSFKNVFFLALLGGFFIALGGHGNLVVTQTLGNIDAGFAKFMGAAVFPVGIMLVVLAGGELFTGNTLISTAWATGNAARWQSCGLGGVGRTPVAGCCLVCNLLFRSIDANP